MINFFVYQKDIMPLEPCTDDFPGSEKLPLTDLPYFS